MADTADLAALGRLLAAPARAAMVDALFDGRAWTVGALGAALLARLESTGGIRRLAPGRAVRLQPAGRALLGSLGVTIL